MIIDDDLLRFCVKKTSEIEATYTANCVLPAESSEFPRSVDDLSVIMEGLHGVIKHRQLRVRPETAKYRSFYTPVGDNEYHLYYVPGLSKRQLRYYKAKELLQIHIHRENLVTGDIVSLVKNMILRESPSSIDLDLGHPTTADTLGEIAAMQFLFPVGIRFDIMSGRRPAKPIAEIANEFDIPEFVVQRSMGIAHALREFYNPA